ncbi:MAG: AAA family ATPase [Armatimonadetes bacterium]|nr:AAA family ATPase [Armatimonadota bacterium]NIM24737.1 AAA family ATPase [Armatimonadota bacterium]NIM68617.1 AAA family ATPase [Armatimonadota bacterium]NIM77134.1 AAA family ATPase [Armatimonadota bacterium]NIN06811.1 AAA family ATPase [Armatimonadota bacterium]
MVVLYICSSEPYAGKSLVALMFGRLYQEMGLKVGYFKPIGSMPTKVDGVTTDEDAAFIAQSLNLSEPLDAICPVQLTSEMLREVFAGRPPDFMKAIDQAFPAVSQDKDLLIVGGLGSVCCTAFTIGLNPVSLVDRLKAKAIVIGKYVDDHSTDMMLAARMALGDRILGIVINSVPRNEQDMVKNEIAPFFEKQGMPVFGILPRDQILSSISVRELAEEVGARVLCCETGMDELVEHFSVGAMSAESALRYFRRIPNKAVVTGGDRSDIQLAALETPTRCLILTGDLQPHPRILTRAEEAGVPVLLTREDTLSAVARIERVLGKLRVREPKKIQRVMELAKEHLDFKRFDAALRGKEVGPG